MLKNINPLAVSGEEMKTIEGVKAHEHKVTSFALITNVLVFCLNHGYDTRWNLEYLIPLTVE